MSAPKWSTWMFSTTSRYLILQPTGTRLGDPGVTSYSYLARAGEIDASATLRRLISEVGDTMGRLQTRLSILKQALSDMTPITIPPLDCSHDELVHYIKSMKGGERVEEMGGSCMIGHKGTVEIRDRSICIRWDPAEYADGAGVMVTSFTGGARLIPDDPANAAHQNT